MNDAPSFFMEPVLLRVPVRIDEAQVIPAGTPGVFLRRERRPLMGGVSVVRIRFGTKALFCLLTDEEVEVSE